MSPGADDEPPFPELDTPTVVDRPSARLDAPTVVDGAPTAGAPRQLPKRLGPYELLGKLAQGGMGTVYRARHTGLQRVCALKLLTPGSYVDEDSLQRFLTEGRLAARLDGHPNLVRIFEAGREPGGYAYLAMELVEGTTLQAAIEGGRIQPRDGARILAQVCQALAHVHRHGIVHRDLKPANILIDRDGVPKLADFGVAKGQGRGTSHTLTGAFMGTLNYMAPEQAENSKRADARSDVYGVGAVLYAVLTRRPPHEGPTPVNVLASVMAGPPPPPRAIDASIEPRLEAVCLRAMARDPQERYPSAEALGAALEEACAAGGAPPQRRGGTGRHPQRSSGRHRSTSGRTKNPSGRVSRRHTSRRTAAASATNPLPFVLAGAALLVGIGAIALTRGRAQPRVEELGVEQVELARKASDGAAQVAKTTSATKAAPGKTPARPEPAAKSTAPPPAKTVAVKPTPEVDEPPPEKKTVEEPPEQTGQVEEPPLKATPIDRTPPRLEHSLTWKGSRLVLSGKALDAGAVTLTWRGKPLHRRPDGRFSVRVKAQLLFRPQSLVARDAHGNEARAEVRFKPTLLLDRERWSRGGKAPLAAEVAFVAHRLGKAFALLGLRRFRCGKLQHRIATFRHRRTGLELNLIPGGAFHMGSRRVDMQRELAWVHKYYPAIKIERIQVEAPRHEVRLPPFLIGRLEVREREWDALGVGKAPPFPKPRRGPDEPIGHLSWHAARAWLKQAGDGLRLPSEAEWEYACRAGSTTRFFWGDRDRSSYYWGNRAAQGSDGFPRSAKPRLKAGKTNGFGLIDMVGNAWEWCEDDYYNTYEQAPTDGRPRRGKRRRPHRILRGGSATGKAPFFRSATRFWKKPQEAARDHGLRVARSLDLN